MTINVITNSGNVEPFDITKIRRVINYACEGLDVSPLQLESKVDIVFSDGMSTSSIQDNLIHHARSLISPKALDWNIVAGRLWTMDIWKKAGARVTHFADYLEKMKGKYIHEGFNKYSSSDIEYLNSIIDPYRDFNHSYSACTIAYNQYIIEGETIHWVFMATAMVIASVESDENRLKFCQEVYDALSLRKISLASPWICYLRFGGNIASCFITQFDDDLPDIYKSWANVAMISKSGGGEGIDFSRMRGKSAPVNGRKNSHQGVLPWVKIINDIAVAVDQSGRRKGAVTVHLPVWHIDFEDFLDCQIPGTGDIRTKSFDIFPQIGIHDKFMEIDDTTRIWYTFCPHEVNSVLGIDIAESYGVKFSRDYNRIVKGIEEGKITRYRQYDSRDFFKKILKTFFETGLPYIFFRDTANKSNPNKHDGNIHCANLCTESFSNFTHGETAHTCSLASIVMAEMNSLEDIRYYSGLTAEILDNGIYLTNPPIEESARHLEYYRTIGVGIMGMHDWVAKNNMSFDRRFHGDLAEVALNVQLGAMERSADLAISRGSFKKFNGSEWHNGKMIRRFIENLESSAITYKEPYKEQLISLGHKIKTTGIRNSQLVSPAPNGSTSSFCDATPGVMPNYSGFYVESKSYTGDYYLYGRFAKENPLCYDRSISRYDQKVLCEYIGAMQAFIDTGISAEYMFDFNKEDASVIDIYEFIKWAWYHKNKAIYYIRFIKKGQSIENLINTKETACLSCGG